MFGVTFAGAPPGTNFQQLMNLNDYAESATPPNTKGGMRECSENEVGEWLKRRRRELVFAGCEVAERLRLLDAAIVILFGYPPSLTGKKKRMRNGRPKLTPIRDRINGGCK